MGRLTNIKPQLHGLGNRLKPPPKEAEQFYTSGAWRSLVASIKRDRGSHCQRCGSTNRIIADHIIERRDGGPDLEASNIELLCSACHARKTAQARARRARGQVA